MRELKIIELIIDILYYPFYKDFYKLADLKQEMHVTKICRLAYTLLKLIVKDNYNNELYASQWIELYFDQAMNTNIDNNIKAEVTLTQLLSNNKKLLEK